MNILKKYMRFSKINKFLFVLFLIPGAAYSCDDCIVKSLSLSNGTQLVIKKDKDGGFYFNNKFEDLYKKIADTPQAFEIESNRSNYYPRVLNRIDYRFLLLNSKNDKIFPMLEPSYPISLDSYNNENSFVIETYKDDVTRYKFLMKYNYVEKINKVILTDIIYIESTINSDVDEVDYYIINANIPDNIKNLEYYNIKDYTNFIINDLYKKVLNLDLNMKLIKSYSEQ